MQGLAQVQPVAGISGNTLLAWAEAPAKNVATHQLPQREKAIQLGAAVKRAVVFRNSNLLEASMSLLATAAANVSIKAFFIHITF